MIDPARWVLAEAWLSLGLRLRTMRTWERQSTTIDRDDLQRDDELHQDFFYEGDGVWVVSLREREASGTGVSPQMGLLAMRHELAHYLAAEDSQRARRNFGLTSIDRSAEDRAIEIEKVLDAVIGGCAQIVATALRARPR